MIAIVTETLSCMNVMDCATNGVSLAPLDCMIDGQVMTDRILTSIPMASSKQVPVKGHTMPPTVDEYRMRFGILLKDFDMVICITSSGKISDSGRHARMAAADFPGRVQVVDSRSTGGGLFLMARYAKECLSRDYPVSRTCAELETYKNRLCVAFTATEDDSMRAAKRLSYKRPVGRPILSQSPVFRIQNGGIGLDTFCTGERQTVEEMLSCLKDPSHIVVHYVNRTPVAVKLLRFIQERYPNAAVFERPITLSLYLNLGSEVVGVVGD